MWEEGRGGEREKKREREKGEGGIEKGGRERERDGTTIIREIAATVDVSKVETFFDGWMRRLN